ncbi:MAG: FixH family protein [Alphaproteobacteria bacterium]|nr:FixH family protein [Alphaproteobacteria bacterium]
MNKFTVLTRTILIVATAFVAFNFFPLALNAQDNAVSQVSTGEQFVVSFTPENPDSQRNSPHAWIAEIKTADGEPVTNATIMVDGGMAAHGHGMPTRPRMTENLGDGHYKIDGMQFHMAGEWQLNLAITVDDVTDTVTFDQVIQ